MLLSGEGCFQLGRGGSARRHGVGVGQRAGRGGCQQAHRTTRPPLGSGASLCGVGVGGSIRGFRSEALPGSCLLLSFHHRFGRYGVELRFGTGVSGAGEPPDGVSGWSVGWRFGAWPFAPPLHRSPYRVSGRSFPSCPVLFSRRKSAKTACSEETKTKENSHGASIECNRSRRNSNSTRLVPCYFLLRPPVGSRFLFFLLGSIHILPQPSAGRGLSLLLLRSGLGCHGLGALCACRVRRWASRSSATLPEHSSPAGRSRTPRVSQVIHRRSA